jgi:hypothetical protein
MKFRKLLVIILVVGLLVVYYVLGTDYREQRHKHAALASQIAGAAQQLALIPPSPTDLEPRQAAASAGLDKEKNTFPAQMNSTRLVNAILKLAEAAGVKAIPMITQPWATASVNQTDYPVFRLNIAAKGTFTQLADFLSRLENGEPGTLVISNLKVDRVTGPPANEGETGDTIEVDASLDIAVYARPSVTAPIDKVE